ncbi:MAG TPA: BCAM0308 family protein [Bradyrhizobium sp.]|nr:BCAM0308 family protein [Stellaceae bacterium]HUO00223.1 BCAM0308 family protein [Bradyrhizobium sp.]
MKGLQSRGSTHPAGRRVTGRAQGDGLLDPYLSRYKPSEPASCPRCGVHFDKGRWQWGWAPENAQPHLCPACRRIEDNLPGGLLTLHDVPPRLKDQIASLVRNEEAAENAEHPLNRIIAIDDAEGAVVVRTTDIHLPRRIGEAVKRAYRGTLDMHFDDDGYFARIDWHPAP